jgi:alkaline phosphatase
MQKLLYCLLLLYTGSFAQPVVYSTANAHSHNDYEQPVPLYTAYYSGFGSIEADIFLLNDSLLVAHTAKDLYKYRSLENLYLKPLQAFIENNNGFVYADTSRKLQLMIDIKTEPVSTLNKLIAVLQNYPVLIRTRSLQIVISGNRPDPSSFTTYPSWIWFDGVLDKQYSKEALSRIVMMSDDLKKYTRWDGNGSVPKSDLRKIQSAVDRAHQLKKPIRFWGAPDYMDAWYQLIQLRVDYLNTDSIKALSAFLKEMPEN